MTLTTIRLTWKITLHLISHKKIFASGTFSFKNTSIFRISHYMRSEVPLSQVRNNNKVSQMLKKYNIRMKYNLWNVNQVLTKGICSLFLINPRALSEDDLLALLTKAGDKKGELFRVTATLHGLPAAQNRNKSVHSPMKYKRRWIWFDRRFLLYSGYSPKVLFQGCLFRTAKNIPTPITTVNVYLCIISIWMITLLFLFRAFQSPLWCHLRLDLILYPENSTIYKLMGRSPYKHFSNEKTSYWGWMA